MGHVEKAYECAVFVAHPDEPVVAAYLTSRTQKELDAALAYFDKLKPIAWHNDPCRDYR